jgi:hypothetical protein
MSSAQDWRRPLLKKFRVWAQEKFPLPYPIRCYIRPPSALRDCHNNSLLGYFEYDYDEERGIIVIANNVGRESFIDTCAEEWAHARTNYLWDDQEDPHTASFWAEYGRIIGAVREHYW